MNTGISRLRDDEGGFGVISAVIVGFVVTAGAITMLSLGVHQNEASAQERDRERAFAAAEAAVSDAMSMMSYDPQNCPGLDSKPPKRVVVPGEYEYEFEFVLPVDATFPAGDPAFACSDKTTLDRYIVARGWVPSEDAPRAQRRQVEQHIRLKPLDGFKYALFAAPGGVRSGNNLTVNGDVYADHDLVIGQQSKIFGDVTGQQLVSIDNNSTVSGDVWALGNVSLLAAGSLVQGDAKTSGGPKVDTAGTVVGTFAGDIANKGTIKKKAMAPGTISGSGSFGGKVTGPIDPPPRRELPTFDPAAVSYDLTHASRSAFYGHWDTNRESFSGKHRVFGTSGSVNFDKAFKVTSGTTAMVVADAPVVVSRDVEATSADTGVFVLVSMATSDESSTTPSILLSNQQKFPPNVLVVLYAPNGCVEFRNLKQFTGVVYAKCLKVANNFTLSYQEPPPLPGFDWTAASATHFEIEAYTFREVRFQP